jgi:hypothetical protein
VCLVGLIMLVPTVGIAQAPSESNPTPLRLFNGASGTPRGLYWNTDSKNRWRLITDSSDDLSLFSYDSAGKFVGTPLLVKERERSFRMNWPIINSTSSAPAAGAAAGPTFSAHNTGANPALGSLFQYFSTAGRAGFDTGSELVAVSDPAFIAGQSPSFEAQFVVSISPNDTSHNWGQNVAEWNTVNRGRDMGWRRDRTSANPTGGLLIVPESITFGQPGEGKNVTYGYSTSRSGRANSTGFPVKFYNNFLCEPDSEVGLSGRCLYATGDITGTASQYPYAPFQTDGTWLHGFSTSRATYEDGYAYRLGVGQGIAWDVGGIDKPTATAAISTTGKGADENIVLKPAGAGLVQFEGPPQIKQSTPASSSAVCTAGQIAVDVNYIYVCTAASAWRRAALSTF